jgi:heptaprenyl diphosphate synthase
MRPTPSSGSARMVATVAMLVAVGAILGIVETALAPAIPVPGVRLGLANLAVVLAVALVGRGAALRVTLLRVLVVALATGSLGGPAFAMALAGAVASWAVMAWLSTFRSVSPIGWSVGGAAAHVGAQLLVASALTGTVVPLLLAPLSLLLALGCGLVIGYSSRLLLSRLPLVSAEFGTR